MIYILTIYNHHFFVIIQETRPSCSWGYEDGISYSNATLQNRCCIKIHNQLACAEDGCNAQVHLMCQWAWLEREKLDMNFNRPTYCPLHNRQRGDFIIWYYKYIKTEPIPEYLKYTTSKGIRIKNGPGYPSIYWHKQYVDKKWAYRENKGLRNS